MKALTKDPDCQVELWIGLSVAGKQMSEPQDFNESRYGISAEVKQASSAGESFSLRNLIIVRYEP